LRHRRQAESADGAIDAVGGSGAKAADETDASAVRQRALDAEQADRPDRRGDREADQAALRKRKASTVTVARMKPGRASFWQGATRT
jgi:hypothetical protein